MPRPLAFCHALEGIHYRGASMWVTRAYQRLDASPTPHLDAVSVAIHDAWQKLRVGGRTREGEPTRLIKWFFRYPAHDSGITPAFNASIHAHAERAFTCHLVPSVDNICAFRCGQRRVTGRIRDFLEGCRALVQLEFPRAFLDNRCDDAVRHTDVEDSVPGIRTSKNAGAQSE